MKKIIAGICTNLLITNLAMAENRIEGIDITEEYEVPFSDNNLGVGVSRTEKTMSNDSGKLINNFNMSRSVKYTCGNIFGIFI